MNRVTSIKDPLEGVTHVKYDENGNAIKIINADKGVMQFEYDLLNRLKKYTDPEGYDFKYTYDANGNIIEFKDGRGNKSFSEYDDLEREVIKIDEASGYVAVYGFDPRNLIKAINYSDGKKARFGYNKNGELVTMSDWNSTVSFKLDLLVKITSVNDQNNKLTAYAYGSVSNQIRITYPDITIMVQTKAMNIGITT
jgi:YD repeat-containing protein